jgi:hypothetical protein
VDAVRGGDTIHPKIWPLLMRRQIGRQERGDRVRRASELGRAAVGHPLFQRLYTR